VTDEPARCPATYPRSASTLPNTRIVHCHLESGHPGEHEEEGTEVTWLPDDHERAREQALADPEVREAYIKARVDAAYERGLAEGHRQDVEFVSSLLGHSLVLDRDSDVDAAGMLSAAIVTAREQGRRQATEDFWREWAIELRYDIAPYASEAEARAARDAADLPHRPIVSRLVGPWEPEGQPEAAHNPRPFCTCARVDMAGAPGTIDGAHHYVPGRVDPRCPFHGEPASGGVVEPQRLRPHRPGDIEVAETRSAGWGFRCHRCDITSVNLDEHGARQRATDHLHLEAPELLARGVVEPSPPAAEEATPDCGLPPKSPADVAARVRAAYGMPAEDARPIVGIKVIGNRPRMTDGCGPEHTYRGSCEYANWTEEADRG